MKGLIELVVTVAIAVALALLIQAFIVKPYRIPSPSMVPTLDIGQRVLTNRLAGNPSLYDVVVFHPPHGADFSNPVCGNPNQGGQRRADRSGLRPADPDGVRPDVHQARGRPSRGHDPDHQRPRDPQRRPEKDSYTIPCGGISTCTFGKPIKIPPGDYFMMGDNRADSEDSRFWGPSPKQMDHRYRVLHVLAP